MTNRKFINRVLIASTLSVLSFSYGLHLEAAPFKPVVKVEGSSTDAKPVVKVGNPYKVADVSYKPKEVEEYDVIGIASWYGEDFHGKNTANGELFDMEELTAAHATLPLPSFVEVTNLDNGKKIILRVNDRGPFKGGRIIDLSKRAAELLGFKEKGTTNVRVQLLGNISKEAVVQMNTVNMKYNKDVATTEEIVIEKAVIEGFNSSDVSIKTVEDELSSLPTDKPGLVNKEEILKSSDDAEPFNTINLAEPKTVKAYTPKGVFVQVGAYNDNNDNIKKQLGTLSNVGVISLQKVDVNGKDVLRLRVGPYGSIDDAIKIKNNLVKLGYNHARVVVEQ